ncbi:MAG: hypothetical protein R2865_02135 [Deinococcales bacterium]
MSLCSPRRGGGALNVGGGLGEVLRRSRLRVLRQSRDGECFGAGPWRGLGVGEGFG